MLSLLLALLLVIGMEVSSGQLVGESASMLPVVSTSRTSSGIYGVGAQPSRVQYFPALAEEALTQAQEIEEVGDGSSSGPDSVLVNLDGWADSSNLEHEVRLAVWRWFPEKEIDYVLCLAWNESRYDRLAVGTAGERGVLQISPFWNRGVLGDMGYTPDDLFDIDRNVQVAAEIQHRRGDFSAWSTARKCGGTE